MADIKPFAGFRYNESSLGRVLCPPYDVIGAEQASALRRDSLNAIHLELPQGEGAARYRNAAQIWKRWTSKGVLRRDGQPSFYVCEEKFSLNGKTHRRLGFLAALGLTPKAARYVTPHERTLAKPKADRLKLLSAVGANISPIFGILADPGKAAEKALKSAMKKAPAARGRMPSGVSYRLWLAEGKLAEALRRAAASRQILIADGHHRFEVGRAYYRLKHRSGADTILAYLCPESDPGLIVLPTHRIVAAGSIDEKNLADCCRLKSCASRTQLLKLLEREKNPYAFGLWDESGYRLAVPRSSCGCRSGLSVEWIGSCLLKNVAPDKIAYSHDAARSQMLARERGGAVVFVKPLTVRDISQAVARVGLLPPKSTYFYPKIATGLVFKGLEAN